MSTSPARPVSLVRSFATVGGYTMVSRVLGFIRDVLIAAVLGTGWVADAYFVAFRFPNLFRRLFAEGAFNAAFVPLFARNLEEDGAEAARRFAADALSVLMWTLLVLTALAEIAMPWLMYVLAPGFAEDPQKFDLAVLLTRIAFPYLLCMSLVALLSGVLNTLGRFVAAAAAPAALNTVLIAVLTWLWWRGEYETPISGEALSWGVFAAGIIQLAMLYFAAGRAGMTIPLVRPRLTPQVRRLVALGIPGMIAGGITQVNIMVGTIIASLQAGAVSYLYYADRIYQLPLGVVGVAIGVVLLPDLSRRLRAGREDAAHWSQNRSLEFSMLLTLPAAFALAAAATPIIRVLFERGAFDPAAVAPTAHALIAFAVGLPAFVLIKVFSPGFFAREDTKTPMYFAGASVAVNIAVSLALFFPFGHVGIAAATSIAGWVNAGLLAVVLARRGHLKLDTATRRRLALMLVASLVMAVCLWVLAQMLAGLTGAQDIFSRVLGLVLLVAAGMAIYGIGVQVTGAFDLRKIRQWVRGAA